jgi:hypothetical protein
MPDKRLQGDEHYLDEVQPGPPRWQAAVGTVVCLIPVAAVVVGGKFLLFDDMPIADFAIRSAICGVLVLVLWAVLFRRRFGEH